MCVTDKNSKEARTNFTVLERYKNATLVECILETGRTHQIRVHLAEIGYPIVGDYVYSNGKNPFGVEGQMLHSMQLEFNHPDTSQNMILKADLPEYFKKVLQELRGEKNE